jgi:hypothetical protein
MNLSAATQIADIKDPYHHGQHFQRRKEISRTSLWLKHTNKDSRKKLAASIPRFHWPKHLWELEFQFQDFQELEKSDQYRPHLIYSLSNHSSRME